MNKLKIAYLVSQYPAVSHTFILREVYRLRALGGDISVSSINTPDRPIESLDLDEAEEIENTFYVKEQGVFKAALALIKLLFKSPLRLFKGIKCAYSLKNSGLSAFFKHFAYLGEAALVGEWMETQDISHVHVHFANPASTVALIASRLYDVTFSLTVHGPDEFYDVTINDLQQKIEEALFIVCISDYTKSQLMRICAKSDWYKLRVIRLGIDVEIFSPHFKSIRSRTCQILCVGRLVPSKGQQILISAFDRLVQKGKKIHLHFIGGGPDRVELEGEVHRRNLQNKVHFSGSLNPHRVEEAYKDADIFALPSFSEGLPVVLMEAMAMEIPCIASWVNGIPELIRHNVEGLLVAPSCVEQLTQTLELLVDDVEMRRRLGQAGRERVREKYNLDVNTRALYVFFREKLKR